MELERQTATVEELTKCRERGTYSRQTEKDTGYFCFLKNEKKQHWVRFWDPLTVTFKLPSVSLKGYLVRRREKKNVASFLLQKNVSPLQKQKLL